MCRKQVVAFLGLLAWAFAAMPAGWAQTPVNGVRVYTEPAGRLFSIDGQTFQSEQDFLWPSNSKHLVTSYDQESSPPGTHYVLWQITTNLSPDKPIPIGQPITADPAVKWVKIEFKVFHRIIVNLVNCPDASSACLRPGSVKVNDKIYDQYAEFYLEANTEINAKAFANSGFVFTGWAPVYGMSRVPTEFDITFLLTGPTQLSPVFRPADTVKTVVNVLSNPPQLQVLADRTPYTAPVALDWEWGTTHSIGANPVQRVDGVVYVFESWSDGGAINHDITVPSQSSSINLVATFVPATIVSFHTTPSGLALSIDGRQNWPSYNFSWIPGSTHQVSAPLTQTDAQGHKYRFVSWSNGKPAGFDYVAGPAPGNDNLTAVYESLGQATVTTAPSGIAIDIDGAACTTPCHLENTPGTAVAIAVPALSSIDNESRLLFQGWSDSGEAKRTIVISSEPKTYTATYLHQNRLTAAASPSDGATFILNPGSSDSFYNDGTLVTIAAKAAFGYRIRTWTGDLTGTASPAAVTLDTPKTITLMLDPIPAISPLGIRSAAPAADPNFLAPGSLISIFGANLAPDVESGAANILPQTLGTVTVRVDDLFLPLAFISPAQINAQLPARLTEGTHQLIVRWEGKPETSAPVAVVRNAPGLWTTGQPNDSTGLLLHSDGSLINHDQPARPGEVISVIGTGLGAYAVPPPDGFLLDEAAGYTLVDPVSVILADQTAIEPLYAGRCGVAVGVDSVRFQLPPALPEGTSVALKLRTNGKESNTVLLPIAQ